MNVRTAKIYIDEINKVMEKIELFDKNHPELIEGTGFLTDAIAFLNDYREVLNNAIEKAEIEL